MSAMDLLCELKTLVTEVGKLFSKVCSEYSGAVKPPVR